MSGSRVRALLLVTLTALAGACASATDRLNEGLELQARGRYMEAVYRYADAVEKDGTLREARERLVAAGDTAMAIALDEAASFRAQGDPVRAARRYQQVDGLLQTIRSVGERLDPPVGYDRDRRMVFDEAIEWWMALGDEAREAGRWTDARDAYASARADFQPTRAQAQTSVDAETALLLEWAEVELADGRPRTSFDLAQSALEVRDSPARDVVLGVRDLQHRALEAGTLVVAVPPVTASGAFRDALGPEFEIRLDEDLALDHWTRPPPFVRMADHAAMRSELRGLLRGVPQTPMLVGRVLELVGADVAAMIELMDVQVIEEDVERIARETRLLDGGRARVREPTPVTWHLVRGTRTYRALADIVLVDYTGREMTRFRAEGGFSGPFERGEFDGNHDRLELSDEERRFFDSRRQAEQHAALEQGLMDELALAIAAGTWDQVLSRIP